MKQIKKPRFDGSGSAELSNPDLYQQNPARFDEASKLLEVKQQEKASKEEAWLELEILAEEING